MDIITIFILVALVIGAGFSYEKWEKNNNKFYFYYFLVLVATMIIIAWPYFVGNFFNLSILGKNINYYILQFFRILIAVLLVWFLGKSFTNKR